MFEPFFFQKIRCLETRTGRRLWPVRDLESMGISVSCPRWLVDDVWYVSTPALVGLLENSATGDVEASGDQNPVSQFRRYLLMEALEPLENLKMPPDLLAPIEFTGSDEDEFTGSDEDEELDIPAGLSTEEFAAWMLSY